jgi:hypothetical protein
MRGTIFSEILLISQPTFKLLEFSSSKNQSLTQKQNIKMMTKINICSYDTS